MNLKKVTYQYKYRKDELLFYCVVNVGREQLIIQSDENGDIRHPTNLENHLLYKELEERIDKYTSQLGTFRKPTNEIEISIIYSHFEDDDVFESSQLLFEIDENHIVSIDNSMLQSQFKEKNYIEAYKRLNSYLFNVYDYPRIKFKSQNVTIFEEHIEVEYSSFKYFGFKDCEPFTTRQLLFEVNRKSIQKAVNGFIEYSKQMKSKRN